MDDLRYPIGQLEIPSTIRPKDRLEWVDQIAAAPARLAAAVSGLGERQLDTPYRAGGWTVRQVVHHLADSHVNAYVRLRLALTEEDPTIRPYREKGWAELSDARAAPIELSLRLLEAIHGRWVLLLRSLEEQDWARPFQHPEDGAYTVATQTAAYAWHGHHHVAHITSLREREGWG